MSCTLDPVVHPKKLSDRQYEDLLLIDRFEHDAHADLDPQGDVTGIVAGLWRIPRTAAGLLLARGWVSQAPHSDRVWISSAGRMAMAYRWHKVQGLNSRLLKGLYMDAALTAATTARTYLDEPAREGTG